MDPSTSQGLPETLANLSVAWVLIIVAVMTFLRLGLIRIPSQAARGAAEILESVIIAVVLVFLIIRPFVVQAYFIPSQSMEPTLLGNNGVGDHILVNKFLYRVQKPRDDEVVVFLAPPEAMPGNQAFIKRLIGRPGDRIQVIAGEIDINNAVYHHNTIRRQLAIDGYMGDDAREAIETGSENYDTQAYYHVKFVPNGIALSDNYGHTKLIDKSQISVLMTGAPNAVVTIRPGEIIRNGIVLNEPFAAEDPDYDLKIVNGEPLKHDYTQYPVPDYRGAANGREAEISQQQYNQMNALPTQPIPKGMYLMMGDNRNDSDDSTVWGLLKRWRIVGEAQFVFWPLNRMRVIQQ